MYDLVKQKSTGFRIIFGIIIFAFVTAVLKMALHESPVTLDDEMVKTANEINSHSPIVLDSTLRFDHVYALPGHIFQYNYTLMTLVYSQIDTNFLKTSGRQYIIEQLKQNPKISEFRNNQIVVQSKYYDRNGKFIITISIYPSEY